MVSLIAGRVCKGIILIVDPLSAITWVMGLFPYILAIKIGRL